MKRTASTQGTLDKVFKRAKHEPLRPTDSISISIEPYDICSHNYLDTVESGALKKAVQGQLRNVLDDFDDSGLTDEQQNVVQTLEKTTDTVVLVTGEAGTGKTYVQHALLKRLKAQKQNVFRIGPTHASVANLPKDSSTYQTFFAMPPSVDFLEVRLMDAQVKEMTGAAMRQPFIQRAKHRSEPSTLIIEEAGMISAEVIERILKTLDALGKNKFRVFLFFDILQLAPVSGKLLIESNRISQSPTLILRTNMRQNTTEDAFVDVLRALAKDQVDDSHYAILQSRRNRLKIEPGRRLCARNITVEAHNRQHLNELPAQTYTFFSEDKAVKKMPDYQAARAPKCLSWCVGAKVVFESTPLHEVGLYNGITGVIVDTVSTGSTMLIPVIRIDKYQLDIAVHPFTEEIMTEATGTTVPTVQATRTQFPFSIGAAMTVHKAQGQTLLGPVEIDLKSMTSPGQMYTALSRLTQLSDLYLKNLPSSLFEGGIEGLRVHAKAREWAVGTGLFKES